MKSFSLERSSLWPGAGDSSPRPRGSRELCLEGWGNKPPSDRSDGFVVLGGDCLVFVGFLLLLFTVEESFVCVDFATRAKAS